MKQKMLIQEILDSYSLKLGELADKVGVSISLVSKIKNGDSPITFATYKKFQKAFPNIEVIGGAEKWKMLYLEKLVEIKNLNKTIEELNAKISMYEVRYDKIQKLCSLPLEHATSVIVRDYLERGE